MKHIQRSWLLLLAIGFGLAGSQPVLATDILTIKRADTLPATTPWNLDELSKPPEFEWGEGNEVRSLFYEGEPYKGEPTRVFAYYATPGSPWRQPFPQVVEETGDNCRRLDHVGVAPGGGHCLVSDSDGRTQHAGLKHPELLECRSRASRD